MLLELAIPMEKLTERRPTHRYSVMDSVYDAQDICGSIRAKGRVPMIDANKRRSGSAEGFDPAKKQRFTVRSTVERANAHLKDWLIGSKILVRGIPEMRFQVMVAVVCLAAVKILQSHELPAIEPASA